MGIDISPVDALKDVYGDTSVLSYRNHSTVGEALLMQFQEDPTSTQSSWGREANIRIFVDEVLANEHISEPRILSAACGNGAEPWELALRLRKNEYPFSIDAFDVSPVVLEQAQLGIVQDIPDFQRTILKELEKGNLVRCPDNKKIEEHPPLDYLTIQVVDPLLLERVHFSQHDIIDSPFSGNGYDAVFCNNLLLHYPEHTRALILSNLLKALRSGGVVALEHNEMLGGIAGSTERTAWLKPYYVWKEHLESFGLTHMEGISPSQRLYRYREKDNAYAGKNWALRDRQLVEVPQQE